MENIWKRKKWIYLNNIPEKVCEASKKYNISPLMAKIILNRFDSADDFFVAPKLYDPFLLNDMRKGVETILKAVENNENIVIYGDYDVDGITSTFILAHYLKSIGASVTYYIPDRMDEGYGLSKSSIETLKENNVDLIITVDLGITAFEEAIMCKKAGIKLVITDHHSLFNDEYPICEAVINPKIKSDYPFENLAGVGVAFKLICALSKNDEKVIEKYLPYVAIGTVTDLVELKDENRYIVKRGLKLLKNTDNIGLISLCNEANMSIENTDAKSIGFTIGPRLNAAGRLSSADISVKLLMEKDKEKAKELSKILEEENNRRKDEEQSILADAMKIINDEKLYENDVIVVSGKDWHHGVIGIVASRITDYFYKPSIVISVSDSDDVAKGSGRSIKGFNLFDALKDSSKHLVKHGGHSLAAGLTIEKQKICDFNKNINAYAKDIITEDIATPVIYIDDTLSIKDITLGTISNIKKLEPFGMGNKTPVFSLEGVKISDIRISNNHAFITATDGTYYVTMPAFNMKDTVLNYCEGDVIDVCGSVSSNVYQGYENAQFIIKDIRPSYNGFLTRASIGNVYNLIKNLLGTSSIKQQIQELLNTIYSQQRFKISRNKLIISLDVLKELGLIDYKLENDIIEISEKTQFLKKTNLEKSKTYNIYSVKKGEKR